MKTHIQDGSQIIYTATGAVTSGDVIALGDRVFVAIDSGVSGDDIPLLKDGVVELPKESGVAVTAGDKCYYDTGASEVDKTDSNEDCGYAYADAASGDATVKVALAGW